FVLGPMLAVAVSGLTADLARLMGEPAVRKAIATSLVLAFTAAVLSVLLSFFLVSARKALQVSRRGAAAGPLERTVDQAPLLILALPPIVIGAGWFVLLRHLGDVFAFAPVMVVLVNAAMAMPFVTRAM